MKTSDVTLAAGAHLDDGDRGGYTLDIEFSGPMRPGIDAQCIMNVAHPTCPYSKATRGNSNGTLAFD